MKAVGVVVEYNPFHNGHCYHLNASKKATGADVIIAAMSGNFLQRGEPALVSKWTRAKMALLGGVDLVFELPFQYATQQAEIFANGAVSILTEAGCDSICFGSEEGNIEAFEETYSLLQKNDVLFQEKVKQYVGEGNSYPKALSLAFSEIHSAKDAVDLSKPNNILGFYYLSAARKQKDSPEIVTIQRSSAEYHDEHFSSDTIASATSIRRALFSKEQDFEQIKRFLPITTIDLLKEYHVEHGSFHHWELYWPFFKYKILQSSANDLRDIHGVEEGIENRPLKYSEEADSFSDFIGLVKTKRYTWTRLQRICLYILTNTKKSEMKIHTTTAPYLRLLGMTEKGREYLNKNKQHFNIPLISKLSSYKGTEVELDLRTSKIYALGLQSQKESLIKEYSQKPIYIKKG